MARAELKAGGGLVSEDFGEASVDAETAGTVVPKIKKKIAAKAKVAPQDHRAFRSARFLRWVGCTRYAMPILAI